MALQPQGGLALSYLANNSLSGVNNTHASSLTRLMNDTLIGLYRPKKRYKRCERNTTNERPSSARVLSTPQYHPSSLTLQRGINLPQSPARPPVNMRNSTLSTAALIAPAKDGREY